MKKSIMSMAVAGVLAASAYATNGDELIGIGAKSRGMGGAGIGLTQGAESALVNPALITSVKSKEVSFGGTIMMPSVETDGTKSDATLSMAPAISIASKVSDSLYIGVGMWGTAGMGVDYRGTGKNSDLVSNMQMMQFGLPIAYKAGALSLGVTPIIQYGALDITYTGSTTQGAAQDLALGYNAGIAYEAGAVTVGAVYKSPIAMTYAGQLSKLMEQQGASGYGDRVERPEEYGIGLGYQAGAHAFALDYKRIKWSDAKGYRDFGWGDQDVVALGYRYVHNNWALRAGYNHAKSPITDQGGRTNGVIVNRVNLLAFPAIAESHYTVGGSYALSSMMSVDAAYVYVPEESVTMAVPSATMTTKHSQSNVSVQLTLNF